MVLVAKISSRRQCNTQTWSHKDINTSNSMLTHASSFTSLSVYWEALCFISADLALCDLSAGCVVTVEWMHLNVTNHYFLLLKLNFDACNQVCLSALLSKWITNQTLFPELELITGSNCTEAKTGLIWQYFVLVSQLFYVYVCHRCMSCLSTRWKCYWDQNKHLCVSSKDDVNQNLLEVSNAFNPPIRCLEELMILSFLVIRASVVIQTPLSKNTKCSVMVWVQTG